MPEKTIDEYAEERNGIFVQALNIDETFSDKIWTELGVANRHISRVIEETLPLRVVTDEIEKCFDRVRALIEENKNA